MVSFTAGWFIAGQGAIIQMGGPHWNNSVVNLPSVLLRNGVSTLLRSRVDISRIVSTNLFGAMCGAIGIQLYVFGFRSLYLMAVGLYLIAFVWDLLRDAQLNVPQGVNSAGEITSQ